MDLRVYVTFIVATSLFYGASAGCVQDTISGSGYAECLTGYTTFMTNAASSMDPNDPSGIIQTMCSPEGQAAMNCILDFVKKCPELTTNTDTAAMFESLKMLDTMGGFDAACSMLSGPCQAVQQCLASQDFGRESSTSSYLTPFSVIQESVGMLCGPVKEMFNCFKDAGDQCKSHENSINAALDMGRSEAPMGTTLPTLEQTKMFIKNECPRLPTDFAASTCVKNSVSSGAFVNCYSNVTRTYQTDNQISCDAYRAGHKCISMTVGESCGAKYTDAFVKATPMFMMGMPSNCKLETSDNTGGSNVIQMSAASVLLALFLALKFKQPF